jgi:hypothetical protein
VSRISLVSATLPGYFVLTATLVAPRITPPSLKRTKIRLTSGS